MGKTPMIGFCCGLVIGYSAYAADEEARTGSHVVPAFKLPAGVNETMLAPPPVPQFMLDPSSRPLSADEMVRQVREAEERANAQPQHTGKLGGGLVMPQPTQ